MLLPGVFYVGMAALAAGIVGLIVRLVLTAVDAWQVPRWLDSALKWLGVIAAVGIGLFVLTYMVMIAAGR